MRQTLVKEISPPLTRGGEYIEELSARELRKGISKIGRNKSPGESKWATI